MYVPYTFTIHKSRLWLKEVSAVWVGDHKVEGECMGLEEKREVCKRALGGIKWLKRPKGWKREEMIEVCGVNSTQFQQECWHSGTKAKDGYEKFKELGDKEWTEGQGAGGKLHFLVYSDPTLTHQKTVYIVDSGIKEGI
nr:hypothetical protein L204_04370 [Cryptococcus depauperatus CBS 7855]